MREGRHGLANTAGQSANMSDPPPVVISKVSIFVIDADDRQLVFEHPRSPSAGIQVPAGTMEPGEEPATAAVRELREETGKDAFKITGFVARWQLSEVRQGREERHDRWLFQASPTRDLPGEWMAGDWTPARWEPFRFYWITRPMAEKVLTPDHAEVYWLTTPQPDLT
jgi:8-oxo-dGTP pyrophosphatase MutT (NUDIX family)